VHIEGQWENADMIGEDKVNHKKNWNEIDAIKQKIILEARYQKEQYAICNGEYYEFDNFQLIFLNFTNDARCTILNKNWS